MTRGNLQGDEGMGCFLSVSIIYIMIMYLYLYSYPSLCCGDDPAFSVESFKFHQNYARSCTWDGTMMQQCFCSSLSVSQIVWNHCQQHMFSPCLTYRKVICSCFAPRAVLQQSHVLFQSSGVFLLKTNTQRRLTNREKNSSLFTESIIEVWHLIGKVCCHFLRSQNTALWSVPGVKREVSRPLE